MRTVRAFDRQTVEPARMEIIVVADGCTDATESTFTSYRCRYRSRLLIQDGLGAAAARNRGAEEAKGSILLFMDDDVEPDPDLVEAHLRAHAAPPGRVVMGPYPHSVRGRSSFYNMRTRAWWDGHFARVSRAGHRFEYRDLVSGNLSMPADLYRELGGFDPRILGAGGEDYEFGVRLIKAGVDISFEPGARAVHHQHETMVLEGSLRRAAQEGRSNVIIGRLHPELRSEMFAVFATSRKSDFRAMRFLVFRAPWLGRPLTWVALAVLPVLEAVKMRRRWRKWVGAVHSFWYWRGVVEEIGSEAALSEYLAEGLDPAKSPLEVPVLDLADGLEAVERRLDDERPASVHLRFGAYELGRVEPLPVAEPLRGAHLRRILAERFPFQILVGLALGETVFEEGRPPTPAEDRAWR
jgi:GT2 family glycosyltransferase